MSIIRHYFPGNNTPEGFFSYYGYILGQREASRIVCIKGGPGTGKSTFLKKVGKRLSEAGESVDFLHCSADDNSLDGIILPDRKIAFVDGTSPHVIDPITPGAVDYIINFGEFWNDKKIADCKEDIIRYNEECSGWYKIAYNYLAAAKKIYDSMATIYDDGIEVSEIYKLAADIIDQEYQKYDISFKSGAVKKFFATGLTWEGSISYLKTLLQQSKKIYLINVPEGYSNTSFMNVLQDGAVYRGFDVESFYCPMDPAYKLEHLLVPELGLAFITTNKWHDLEPWEITGEEGTLKEITMVDISDYQSTYFAEKNAGIIGKLSKLYASLIQEAMDALARAKETHDLVEKMYIRNMDFEKIDQLVEDTVAEILK
ncbi:ATPase [Emergencia sp. 1XD21-10]|uniref:ATPase n=1 Tax=Emergencia sp. 1XD21-10 TaxID=2304569 RepID=UPI00137A97E4|nr:ATPase [Emergencia sp. 1XD21-10]NCE97526.1 ATPase [Emergencia sp. 1XD21-10]